MRFFSTTALLVALAFVLPPRASAQLACNSEFGDALTAIDQALLAQGNSQKIATKVRNAWRMYASASQNGKANALKELRLADDLIDGASMKAVPAGVKQTLHASIDAVRTCISTAPAVQTTSLTVRVLARAEAGSAAQPAGVNVIVSVAGITGKTKGDSTATLTVPVGTHSVMAQLGTSAGFAKVTLVSGTPAQAEVVMEPNRDTSAGVMITSPEVVDGVLARDFAALTLLLENTLGEAIPVDRLQQVEIRVAGTERRVVTPMFRTAGGAVALADRAAFAAFVLGRIDPFELHVRVLDKAANVFQGVLRFAVGRFRPTATITGASPANVTIKLIHERTNFVFWATSGADGAIAWPLLPDGPYLLEGETVQGGQRLYARGGFILDRDKAFAANFIALSGSVASGLPRGRTTVTTASQAAAVEAAKRERRWFRIEPDGSAVPEEAPRQSFPVVGIVIDTNRDFGTFQARFVDALEWPEPLPQATEDELDVVDAEVASGAFDKRLDRPVTIRGMDGAGNVVHRQVVLVRTSQTAEVLRPPGSPDPEPAVRAAQAAEQEASPGVSFRIRVPAGIESVEIRGWRPGQAVLWEMSALRSDPALSNNEARRGDR